MLTVDRVEVRGLAERILAFSGRVANVVTVLVATNEANIGVDFVGLRKKRPRHSWFQPGFKGRLTSASGELNLFAARGVAG